MTPPIRLKKAQELLPTTRMKLRFDVIQQSSYPIASCKVNGIQCVPDRKEGIRGAKGKWKSVSPTAPGGNKGKGQRVEDSHLPCLSSSL